MSWTTLTVRLKQNIVGILDYESRCHLRTCSKDDRDTVDSTKFVAKTFKISEIRSQMAHEKSIIRFDIDTLTIWFIGKNDVTKIERGWNGVIIEGYTVIKQNNRYQLVIDFLEKWSVNGFINAGTVEINFMRFAPPTTCKFKCDKATLFHVQNNHTLAWLRNITPYSEKFEIFEVRSWGEREDIMEVISNLKVSKTLKIDQMLNLSDEQLESSEAMDLIIHSSAVTTEGVKKRLETFLKLGQKIDRLELIFPVPNNFDARAQLIPKSLIVKKLKKEQEQEGEYYGKIFGGFVNIHGEQDAREIDVQRYGNTVTMTCEIYKISTDPCILYPFYHRV